ncbi:hypothetical protein PHPALM_28395 [Phytophthora palmivora]|uniref:DDE Tnp4 domain-containing protein n=1 Tax=Phytophthora palmivora TaxID=4796 RepID=A0A2P4XA88_9STRA|nr:hypothetical protein PHPALM_28395 [Phytophthora palmivora]
MMESRLTALIVLLLLVVIAVAIPVGMRQRCRLRTRIDWESHSQLLSDEDQFKKYYNMSYASFMALAAKLEPYLAVDEKQSRNQTGIEPITHIKKLQMCLLVAYHDIRTNSGVSVGAFYAAIHEVVDVIIAHPDLQLRFPTTVATQRHATKSFERLSSSRVVKGCIGAVDGWLCPIRVPWRKEVARSIYRCDVLKCWGHQDAVAFLKWRLSSVVKNLPNGLYVVGDNAYTNSNHLLTPFPRPKISTAAHDSYNYHLSQVRIRIEMAFGLLDCKWRVFKTPLEIAFKRVPRTILAASGAYCVEEDEILLDGIEYSRFEQDPPADFIVEPQDSSRYRRLYDSSDLATDSDSYNNSEWARDALVGFIENNSIMRPSRNQARRAREQEENQ